MNSEHETSGEYLPFLQSPPAHLLWQWFYKTLLSVTRVWSAINTCIRYIKAAMTSRGLIWFTPCEQGFLLPARKEVGCAHEKDNSLCLLILSRRERTLSLYICSNCRRHKLPKQGIGTPTPRTPMDIPSSSASVGKLGGTSLNTSTDRYHPQH